MSMLTQKRKRKSLKRKSGKCLKNAYQGGHD